MSGTLNYEELYAVIKSVMEVPTKLLETVAHSIAERTLSSFPEAIHVEVKISKFNPPIGGVCRKATVVVSLEKK